MKDDDKQTDTYLFLQLFESSYSKIKKMAYELLRSEFDAEDVAQEVFTKLWEQQSLWLDNERDLNSYLLIMARNIALNVYKHQQVKQEYQNRFLGGASCKMVDDEFLERIYSQEMLQLIHATLAIIPERRRTVFELSRFNGKSYKEIAERMNISVRTVERQIYLTLIDLRKVLNSFEYECEIRGVK
jgi:RNA polymerase sigma factor, sigma-70 family/RNA polymerase sigma-70 factor, Bacteroides expansion family 1